jgi:hypothetical protein
VCINVAMWEHGSLGSEIRHSLLSTLTGTLSDHEGSPWHGDKAPV